MDGNIGRQLQWVTLIWIYKEEKKKSGEERESVQECNKMVAAVQIILGGNLCCPKVNRLVATSFVKDRVMILSHK